jgi:hypothetical protein
MLFYLELLLLIMFLIKLPVKFLILAILLILPEIDALTTVRPMLLAKILL